MKKWMKVIAWLLAAALLVSGLPLNWAFAEGENPEAPPAMRLVQKDGIDGFDPETGILTMTLEVRTSEPAKIQDGTPSGRFLKEAYLAFQVDTVSLMPILYDGTPIQTVKDGNIAFVTSDLNSALASPQMQELDNVYYGNGYQINRDHKNGAPDFAESMGVSPELYDGHKSGFFASRARQGETDMLDCYLHVTFPFNSARTLVADEANDNYVEAFKLRFQCYSGYDENGNPAPTQSDGKLYQNSIRLPAIVDAEDSSGVVDEENPLSESEAEALVRQFYSRENDPTTRFSSGAAGFREQSVAVDEWGDYYLKGSYVYYYYDAPVETVWQGTALTGSLKGSTQMEGTPTLRYTGMEKSYAVTGFDAKVMTTVETNGKGVVDSLTGETDPSLTEGDFKVPESVSDSAWNIFRYSVPKDVEMKALQEAARETGIWKGLSYGKYENSGDKMEKMVALGYQVGAEVSPASTTIPETDVNSGGFTGFMSQLNWKFAYSENNGAGSLTTLDHFLRTTPTLLYNEDGSVMVDPETGNDVYDSAPYLVREDQVETVVLESTGRTYTVQAAVIDDRSSNYNGYKVQVVKEIPSDANPAPADTQEHVMPVGVLLDFSEKTMVRYTDDTLPAEEQEQTVQACAPQLRVSSAAADQNSYLWAETDKTRLQKGFVYLIVTYTDAGGGENVSSNTVRIQLYKDTVRQPTKTVVEADPSLVVVPGEGQAAVPGFAIPYFTGEGDPVLNDVLQKDGIVLKANVYDQYGVAVKDGEGNPVQIDPQNIQISPSGAFNITRDAETGEYRLRYAGSNNVNSVAAGNYTITASYTDNGAAVAAEPLTFCVTKEENRFSYLGTDVSVGENNKKQDAGVETGENPEPIQVVELLVPGKSEAAAVASVDITELANQWRRVSDLTQENYWDYDIIPGLRNANNELNMNNVKAKFRISYDWHNAAGTKTAITGVNTNSISSGRFGYTYEAGAEGASPLYVDVSVTYPQPPSSRKDLSLEELSDETGKNEGAGGSAGTEPGPQDPIEGEGPVEYVTLTNRYKFVFTRSPSVIDSIRINYLNDNQAVTTDDITLKVPEEGAQADMCMLNVIPYDQYDASMGWPQVYEQNPGVDGWNLRIVGNKTYEGITIAGSTISVNGRATATEKAPYEFDIVAEYGRVKDDGTKTVQSNPIHVIVTRTPARPVRITDIIWTRSDGQVYSQNNSKAFIPTNGESEVTLTPTLTVMNQYGQTMTADQYRMTWKVETGTTALTDPLITLDPSTGVLKIKGRASGWTGGKLRVTLNSRDGTLQQSQRPTELCTMSVERYPEEIGNMQLTTTAFQYPRVNSDSRTVQLEVTASSQYGDNFSVTPSLVNWTLSKVTYQDGTSVNYMTYPAGSAEGEPGTVTGQITRTQSGTSAEWTDTQRRTVRLYSGTVNPGILEFSALDNSAHRPVSIELEFNYSGQEATKAKGAVTVTLPEPSYASTVSLYSPQNETLSAVLKVPNKGETVTRNVAAYVRDQYNFLLLDSQGNNVPVKWEILNSPLKGIKLAPSSGSQTTITVDNTAENGSISLRASYTYTTVDAQTGEETTVTRRSDLPIGVGRDPGDPTTIVITGIEDHPDELAPFEVMLPGLTEKDASFTLTKRVEDNYGVVLTNQAVRWRVKSDPYGLVKTIGAGSGKVTIACNENWSKNCNADTSIIIEAIIDGVTGPSGGEIKTEKEIKITKAKAFPAYAVPKLETAVYSTRTGHETDVLIPDGEDIANNGGKPLEATFSAKVYSQYREEMPAVPARVLPAVENGKTVQGLVMEADPAARTATMKISTDVALTGAYAEVWAVPESNHEAKDSANSVIKVYFDRGLAKVSSLALGSSPKENDNPSHDDLVSWRQEDPNAPIPNFDSTVETYVLKAMAVDQYGVNYSESGGGYEPVWEFAEPYEDVWFDDSFVDSKGNAVTAKDHLDDSGKPLLYGNGQIRKIVSGEEIRICVGNKALQQFEHQKEIKLNVWVNGKENAGPQYCGVQTLTLRKAESKSQYLYFENIDEDGFGPDIIRPKLQEDGSQGKATVDLNTVVYDQYGYIRSNVPVVYTFSGSNALAHGAEIIPVYARNSQVDGVPSGETPSLYRIKKNGVTLAELDPATGELSVYSACGFAQLEIRAQSPEIHNTIKNIRFHIISETARVAHDVQIHEDDGTEPVTQMTFEFRNSDKELISKHFYSLLRDQYGEALDSEGYSVRWALKSKDKDGNFIDYVEYDRDEQVIPAADRFIRIDSGEAFDVTMLFNPEKSRSSMDIYLECVLSFQGAPTGIVSRMEGKVRILRSSGGGGGPYEVFYRGGEFGTVVENAEEMVAEGHTPILIPKLKVQPGYGLEGWLMNGGVFVKEPRDLIITERTMFTAQYFKLEDEAFLSGYSNGTAQPGQAVTRGEFARMLVGSILEEYDPVRHYDNPFRDVGANRYYTNYIACANYLAVASGYGDGTFRPEKEITRAEASAMVAAAMKLDLKDPAKFGDVSADAWYSRAVGALTEAGVIAGYADGTFRPNANLSRAEATVLLVKASPVAPTEGEIQRIKEVGVSPFRDVPKTYWAYPYILRAAGVA